MRKKYLNIIIISFIAFILNMGTSFALNISVTASDVNLRKGPGTNYSIAKKAQRNEVYTLLDENIVKSEAGCSKGWYKLSYDNNIMYICADYANIYTGETTIEEDKYLRPWTTPGKAIIGGAKYISATYISKGQFTSYLKKFNVNPSGSYNVYNHQYMANLQAPYSESYSSFKSYRDNNLLVLPLEFTIPIFLNMPEVTILPGKSSINECQTEIIDQVFEEALNREGFPESYKCKLRILHNTYPNWVFKAMHTNLDFSSSVNAEQNLSSIQGGDIYYDLSSGSRIQTENGWYRANKETVAYYLDPRNFLVPERVLMFESLVYSENYNENVVSSVIAGTFMNNISVLDNKSYAKLFVEAGISANMSAVYLASLARQESGTKGSRATSGMEFTYKGITYKGLYNFYNIGAFSSAESPILAGLVWASNGSTKVVVKDTEAETPVVSTDENTTQEQPSSGLLESNILSSLGYSKKGDCLIGVQLNTKLIDIKNKLSGLSVNIVGVEDNGMLGTGNVLSVSDGVNTYNYNIVINGDVDGDGQVGATDYVKIKNYIMERSGSELSIASSLAADVDGNGSVGATDYVQIKNSIMER